MMSGHDHSNVLTLPLGEPSQQVDKPIVHHVIIIMTEIGQSR
jgi:hypothetical protein